MTVLLTRPTVVVVVYGVLFMDWSNEIKSKNRSRGENDQPHEGGCVFYQWVMEAHFTIDEQSTSSLVVHTTGASIEYAARTGA